LKGIQNYSPYGREAYRYTPLLALLLVPNEWIHPSFGKYLFAACDIANGALIYNLLVSVILPRATHAPQDHSMSKNNKTVSLQATFYCTIYLLNPLVFSISTRGSSESVLSLFVLLTLYAALRGRWDTAAVMLGLSTHWKIYPAIYGVGCLSVIGASDGRAKGKRWKDTFGTLLNPQTIRFGVLSSGTFFVLGIGCYFM
jgi:phosphatidylinositol glycan class M